MKYEVVAVKHNERRNGERTPMYWCIESDEDCNSDFQDEIYDHWFCKELPKRISKVLETSPEDPEGWGIKRGRFTLILKDEIKAEDFGHVNDFKNVISIIAKS